jgi:hypothetical protein
MSLAGTAFLYIRIRNFKVEWIKWLISVVKHWDRVMFNIEFEDIAVYCDIKCRF